tara:strand:- start:270 stop:395 length:126 start_codon:yes stop_codon:yes gene_type:complete
MVKNVIEKNIYTLSAFWPHAKRDKRSFDKYVTNSPNLRLVY